jgi:hypothetical protein
VIDRLTDLILFRFTGQKNDNNANPQPVITTGSIVLGALMRLTIVVLLSWWAMDIWRLQDYWSLFLLAIITLVMYPAYRQYTHFNDRITVLQESTLCGSCRHFDSTGQLCKLYDQHISTTHIPCEGQEWEPRSIQIQ